MSGFPRFLGVIAFLGVSQREALKKNKTTKTTTKRVEKNCKKIHEKIPNPISPSICFITFLGVFSARGARKYQKNNIGKNI